MFDLKAFEGTKINVALSEDRSILHLIDDHGHSFDLTAFNVERLAQALRQLLDSGSMVSKPYVAAVPLPPATFTNGTSFSDQTVAAALGPRP